MFLDVIAENCRAQPHKTAIQFLDGAAVSYAQLDETSRRSAHYLRDLGVEAGDRVAVQLPKCLAFLYLHLATMQIGAVFLPLNPDYPPAELQYFLADAGARLFFADKTKAPALTEMVASLPTLQAAIFIDAKAPWQHRVGGYPSTPMSLPSVPEQTAMMLYTSGTTSRPKGAEITHGNLSANISALHAAWGWHRSDRLLHALPIFHVHGLVVALHGALHAGASALLCPRFDAAQVLDLLQSRRFSVFMGVPTMHRRLYALAGGRRIDLSHLRLMTSGSDRLPDELFFGYQKTFNITLLERYGMTETGMNLSNPLQGERRVGSVGLPLPGVAARISDPETGAPLADGLVGALEIKGAHVCKGYWQQPEQTAAAFTHDGWLRTGDMALRAADGYYTLKGRAKDLIITGGFNVYPPEVELVLMQHPGVAACAVIGCADAEWGEQVLAAVIAQPGASLRAPALRAFCRERLAGYKVPRRVAFLDELPRNALGKVQKAKLRANLCA